MKAICVLTNTQDNITGCIEFTETPDRKLLEINLNIKGLSPGYHGFHIHSKGDLREGCTSLCSHFNPDNTIHGDISDNKNNRHAGDLGNVLADKNGNVNYTIYDKLIKLYGKYNIIGRSVVIHEDEDDLGQGGLSFDGKIINEKIYNESIKTGNAGKRIACGVIGWA